MIFTLSIGGIPCGVKDIEYVTRKGQDNNGSRSPHRRVEASLDTAPPLLRLDCLTGARWVTARVRR